MNIPFLSLQDVTAKYADEIHEAVKRVVDSGWYLQGKENEQFEKHYAEYIGSKHCIGCANGLDALIWIFRAYIELGVMKPGDEVIVPANTYIATILAITENGLVPVLVDPRQDTLQIDDSLIEERITERTKAICIVHLYGRNACTNHILDLCKKYNVKAIMAHNAMFDYKATKNTQKFLTNGKYSNFLPYGIEIWDTMKMAQDVIATKKSYIKFCEENGYMTNHKKPRVQVKAEVLYRFISGDNDFIENHTGLEDVLIEKEIFAYCVKQKKAMRRNLFE